MDRKESIVISRREFLSKTLKISAAAATAMIVFLPDLSPEEKGNAEAFVSCCYRNCYRNCHSNRSWR